MEQIPLNSGLNRNYLIPKNQQIQFLKGVTECFSEYFANMFKDFGQLVAIRLERHHKKLIENQYLLTKLINKLDQGKSQPLMSLGNLENIQQNSNLFSRVQSLSANSFKKQNQLHFVNKALRKLQQGIDHLQASLTCLKSKKSIEDPQITNQTHNFQSESTQSGLNNQKPTASKIQKLTSKISRFAKQSSLKEIEKESTFKPRSKQKSRSLITLSSRRYHPFSCPKRYDYGLFQTRSQINIQNTNSSSIWQYYRQNKRDSSFGMENFSILLQENSYTIAEENKMPLINKSKSLMNEIIAMVKDEADANVVMFYLKKGLRTLGQIANSKKIITDGVNTSVQIKQKSYPKALSIKENNRQPSQYFTNKSNTLQIHQNMQIYKDSNLKNLTKSTLAQSGRNLNQIKENCSSVASQIVTEKSLTHNMHHKSHSSINSNLSRERRKFQRTSNDQKIPMLKNKFRPTY